MTQISESGATQFSGSWPIDRLIEELKAQVNEMKAEICELRRINRELQWRVDPWSSEGEAVCNSD